MHGQITVRKEEGQNNPNIPFEVFIRLSCISLIAGVVIAMSVSSDSVPIIAISTGAVFSALILGSGCLLSFKKNKPKIKTSLEITPFRDSRDQENYSTFEPQPS